MKYETQNTGIENMRYDFMPVGSIVPFASDIIPLGWLLCDGAPIERSRYPELFDLIGDKLPDHRGMFLRGNDNGRGVDHNRILGSEQGDAIRNITGEIGHIANVMDRSYPIGFNASSGMAKGIDPNCMDAGHINASQSLQASLYAKVSLDASLVVPTAEENRPKNNSVNYIIKALHIANQSMEYQVADGLNHKIETNRNNIDFNLLATLGISYGGILNNTNPKLAGVAYYDEIARKLFKCIANTSINYADAGYFEALSNNDLLGKLQEIRDVRLSGKSISVSSFHLNGNQPVGFKYEKTFPVNAIVVPVVMSYLGAIGGANQVWDVTTDIDKGKLNVTKVLDKQLSATLYMIFVY